MANAALWIKIIKFILEIILTDGVSRAEAVHLASEKFGVSEYEIREHGIF